MINSLLAAWVNSYINTEGMVPGQADTAIWEDRNTEMHGEMETDRAKALRADLNREQQQQASEKALSAFGSPSRSCCSDCGYITASMVLSTPACCESSLMKAQKWPRPKLW